MNSILRRWQERCRVHGYARCLDLLFADGMFGTETTRYFVLRPDGTCRWSSQAESSGNFPGKDSTGATVWSGGVAGSGGSADTGTWSAADGKLFVLWADGSTGSWSYGVQGAAGGSRMYLTGASGKADEWNEIR